MRRWRGPAGLAERYGENVHVILANPFEFNDSVYATAEEIVVREGLQDRPNLSFHRSATHPCIDRGGAHAAPGWNSTNDETAATEQHGVWVLFDRHGRLAFRGRATLEEIEQQVEGLVGER